MRLVLIILFAMLYNSCDNAASDEHSVKDSLDSVRKSDNVNMTTPTNTTVDSPTMYMDEPTNPRPPRPIPRVNEDTSLH